MTRTDEPAMLYPATGAAQTTHPDTTISCIRGMRPPPAPQQMEPQPHTAPPRRNPRLRPTARCRQCYSRRCRCQCPTKWYSLQPSRWRVIAHHRCGRCRNGYRQCFRDCRLSRTLNNKQVRLERAPPQYPQHPAATAHGSAPPAASAQLALPSPPAASLPPFRPFCPRAASPSPAASAAAVGGFGPSTQGEFDDLVHTSGSAENPEYAPPPRKERKAKMYVKSPYYHLWTRYVLQHKKDLRGVA